MEELKQENPSPVLLYKPQGLSNTKLPSLEKGTFILALMTKFQEQLYNSFSEEIVCIDATHSTNQYGFYLVTVLVADEFHNG